MRNVYVIDDFRFENDNLYFSLNESPLKIQIEPAGQVLTDSDGIAFVYVVDEGDHYSYLQFPKKSGTGLFPSWKRRKIHCWR